MMPMGDTSGVRVIVIAFNFDVRDAQNYRSVLLVYLCLLVFVDFVGF